MSSNVHTLASQNDVDGTGVAPRATADVQRPFEQMDGTKLMYHVDELAAWKRGEDIYPLHVDVGVHCGCTHRCVHCYLGHLGHQAKHLDRDVLLGLMDSFGNVGVKSIFFAGSGEPLMNPHLEDAALRAVERGVDVSMASNGLLMTAERAEKILPALSWIRFSIQAGDAETYQRLHGTAPDAFDTVMDNLQRFVALRSRVNPRTSVGVLMCLMPGNEQQVPALASLVKDAGVDYFTVRPPSVNPTRPLDCPVWDMRSLHEQLDRAESLADESFAVVVRRNLFLDQEVREYRKCLGLPFLTQVDGDGGVYACGVFVGQQEYCYGNLNEATFEQIWHSDRRREVMQRMTDSGDFSCCDNLCRLHNINKYLWRLSHPPDHVNFI